MPNMGDLEVYLSSDVVKAGDKVKFVNAGKFVEKEFQGEAKTVLEITVEIPGGKKKLYSPNRTSWKSISAVYGSNTEEWVGKSAEVDIISQNVAGQIRKVVYLKPCSSEGQKPAPGTLEADIHEETPF